jgi:tRNA(His) 5'-end guanylyltransferase
MLSNRVKLYESVYSKRFIPKIPIIIRVDGRAFHTWTKGLERPFDDKLIRVMAETAMKVAADCDAAAFYAQSDEITFLLLDDAALETQQWFGGNHNKIVSVSASLTTAHFNSFYPERKLAFFDSRAFQAPKDDVPNIFLWRVRDWLRNSLNMFALSHFSHRQLQGKNCADRHEMLFQKGVNWADLPHFYKNGTFWSKKNGLAAEKLDSYSAIKEFIF